MRSFNRFSIALFALLLMLASASASASVEAFVDRNPVALDQSFTLTLKSSEDGNPDLKPLQQNFDIINQAKSNSFRYINGQSSHTISWQITLMPKHAGQLLIPPLSVNGSSSAPITLTVAAAAATSQNQPQQNSNLFLEVSAAPLTAYVQQQIILSVRLYRAVDLGDGNSLSEPEFPNANAMVEKLGDDRTYQTVRNGQNYEVIERRYVVYPQKSGQFSMEPIRFDGNVVDNTQSNGFFFDPFNQHTKHVRVRSQSLHISVKPAAAQFDGKQWLPATALKVTETWSQNPPTFKVGEPITRTLTITAQGLTASQLSAIGTEAIDGFKLYPDQATLKNKPVNDGMAGIREQKIALIPTRAGQLELPAVQVKWWNIRDNREETAEIPARSVTVVGAPSAQNAGAIAPPEQAQAPVESAQHPAVAPAATASSGWWPWISLLLGTGWLLTALAWWLSRRAKPRPALRNHPADTIDRIESRLKKTCLENDAPQATTQLLAWAKLKWPSHPPTSLTAMAQLSTPALADALIELDRVRYAKGQSDWRGDTLWRVFTAQRPGAGKTAAPKNQALESLYD
jgi:hypothetical protein